MEIPNECDDEWLVEAADDMCSSSVETSSIPSGNITKAGLPSDRTKIDSIIKQSTNPRFANHQARREERIEKRVVSMKRRLQEFHEWPQLRSQVDAFIADLEKIAAPLFSTTTNKSNDCILSRWVHLDMDAFFASVEELDNPALRDLPMAVGCSEMLSTANYTARKFGVVSAMPGYIAKRLCPQLVLVPTNFQKYRQASERVEAVILDFLGTTGSVLSMPSLDEASFGVSGKSLEEIYDQVEALRARIHAETGLTCTAGIAPTRALAKVCSNVRKPNGRFALPEETVKPLDAPSWLSDFYWKMPVQKINFVGAVTATLLDRVLGVKTVGDLFRERYKVRAAFTDKQGLFLLALSRGLQGTLRAPPTLAGDLYYNENDDEEEYAGRKSCSVERTFTERPFLLRDREKIVGILEFLAEHLEGDLSRHDYKPLTITLKWKSIDFEVRQRSSTLNHPVTNAADLLAYAVKLLDSTELEKDEQVRLLGLRGSNFFEDSLSPSQSHLDIFIAPMAKKPKGGKPEPIKCPVCEMVIARLAGDDPRLDLFVNAHLDKCVK